MMLGTAPNHADALDALKKSLRQIAPTALVPCERPESGPATGLPTGHVPLDRLLHDGGLPRGKLSEVAGAPSSGKTSFAFSVVRTVQSASTSRTLAAYIDGRGQFFPPAAAALGVDLDRLLWVRPGHRLASIARATEILIRSRAFALIIIDVPTGARLRRVVAQRLSTSASQTNTSLLVLCDRAGDVEGAHTRLQISPRPGATGTRRATVLVHKGSATAAAMDAPLSLPRRRGRSLPSDPIAATIERTPPGAEPPRSRHPEPSSLAVVPPLVSNRAI